MLVSDEDPTTQPVFTSLQEVLDLLESEKFRNLLPVQQLLFAYFNICQSKRISYLPKPIRQPFIVVEGNHRTAKRMLAMRLSRRIGASLFHNPPRCLSSLRNFFPTGSLLLRAYFKLCAYALAQATRRLINIFPVILNGYWLEQQTYAIARTYGSDPPPADHPVYRWPNNLLKPDLIFFIEFPDNLHKEILTTRPPNAHKTLAMNALLKMNIPSLVVINTTRGHDVALQEMERHIIDRLGLTFPIRWLNTTRGPSRIHLRNIRVKKV
ncbi:UMP kinase activity protein [Homalodisca vitripennis]|nr:UMP kinase activity protein [Homalodisca vitripennis]